MNNIIRIDELMKEFVKIGAVTYKKPPHPSIFIHDSLICAQPDLMWWASQLLAHRIKDAIAAGRLQTPDLLVTTGIKSTALCQLLAYYLRLISVGNVGFRWSSYSDELQRNILAPAFITKDDVGGRALIVKCRLTSFDRTNMRFNDTLLLARECGIEFVGAAGIFNCDGAVPEEMGLPAIVTVYTKDHLDLVERQLMNELVPAVAA